MTLVDVMNTVEQFCATWGEGHLSSDVADKLTCTEVEALAELFDALGDEQSAQQWIRDHSFGDDCGDRHCQCVDCTPHEHTYEQNPHYCDICHEEPKTQLSPEQPTGN